MNMAFISKQDHLILESVYTSHHVEKESPPPASRFLVTCSLQEPV